MDMNPCTIAFEGEGEIDVDGERGGSVDDDGNGCDTCPLTRSLGSSSSSSSSAVLLELCWEKLHLGYWKDVSLAWRNGYSLCCLVDAILRLLLGMKRGHQQDDLDSRSARDSEQRGEVITTTSTVPPMEATKRLRGQRPQWRPRPGPRPRANQLPLALLQQCLRQLDLGLMMGGPLWRQQIHQLVEGLHAAAVEAAARRAMQEQVASAVAIKADKRDKHYINPATGDGTDGGGGAGGPGSGDGDGDDCSDGGDRPTKRLCGAFGLVSVPSGWEVARGDADTDVRDAVAEVLEGSRVEQFAPQAEHGGGSFDTTTTTTTTSNNNGNNNNKPSDVACDVQLPRGSLYGPLCSRVPTVERPGMEDFLMMYMVPEQPVVVTGAMEHWPAMKRWGNLSYLEHAAGCRTIPVEVGEHYLADGWGQQLMTLRDFLHRYLLPGVQNPTQPQRAQQQAQPRGYLAQHPLFEQIPALRRDIVQPDYCCLGQEGEVQAVNAWLGPAGTTTPLHTDPHHNLLAQVVGRKYVRLYAPSLTNRLYPFPAGTVNSNSSQVDLDLDLEADLGPDSDFDFKASLADHDSGSGADAAGSCSCRRSSGRFPGVAKLPYLDVVLEPGQMLYIPPGWWHFVRAMSTSFSVSFWWR
ncbi:hypothetical protein Vretimale_2123 [Volvox reticuliferus]|nr:hypothetical protein Vretimale_2123 [Volvox reticuliferus]